MLFNFASILGAFTNLQKRLLASSYLSVCLSVCPSASKNSASTGRIFIKFHIWVLFENLSRNSSFTKITTTLYAGVNTFMIISRQILLRMRNVWDESGRGNQNTYFTFNDVFPKILQFMRKCGKIRYRRTGHRSQHNMAHALCMLDN